MTINSYHRHQSLRRRSRAKLYKNVTNRVYFLPQAEAKKDELKSAQGVQTFHIECRETVSWIEDKKRILQQTDNLEMDLNGKKSMSCTVFEMFFREIKTLELGTQGFDFDGVSAQ